MTIEPGNLNDQTHFKKTYRQSRNRLREGSLVIFDKGANSVANTQMIRADHLQYITGKKLTGVRLRPLSQLFTLLLK